MNASSSASTSLQADPLVARELLLAAIGLVRSFGVASKEDSFVFSIDSAAAMASDLDYNALLGRLGLLAAVELGNASLETALSFWLNTYHILLIVSMVEMFPYSPKDRLRNSRNCSLFVCGERLSLQQIEFAILRSAKAMPSLPASHLLGGSLPRRHAKFAAPFDGIDDRMWRLISYGISYLCPGTPALQAYHPGTVIEALDRGGMEYLARGGGLKTSKKSAVVSAYLEWFQSEADAKAPLESALATWISEVGMSQQLDAGLRIKFEDNVMLDEIVLFLLRDKNESTAAAGTASGNNNNEVNGVHFASLLSPRVDTKGKEEK